ncbi:homeobox protein nk-2 [Culex quinquefasciatus]|uniref:Homeobox protein nk-2 n=1 Tax=Culex quinquefasciatus TaxID=7176 RepID=B0X648_CULQU|nr:homeobox protein nk-2 [Culex quinquefasciatus]|eukprot:XP_001865120.1 homeobox protein nk-2 [Culex quinquefasciatus]
MAREGRLELRGGVVSEEPARYMSTTLSSVSGVYPEDSEQEHGLLPDLNGVDLVMSLSPKSAHHHHHHLTSLQHLQNLQHSSLHSHSTPFSVTDILSPIEEYRKLELTNPPSPYSGGSSVNSPSALGGGGGGGTGSNTVSASASAAAAAASSMANPYAMGSLYHSPGVQSYCGPTDNLSLAGHYTDMRSTAAAGWYPSTASDPRFAKACKFCDQTAIILGRGQMPMG